MENKHSLVYQGLVQIIDSAITHLRALNEEAMELCGSRSLPFRQFIENYSMARINFNRRAGHSTALLEVANRMILEGKQVVVVTLNLATAKCLRDIGLSDDVHLYTVHNLKEKSKGLSSPDVVFIDLWSHIKGQLPWFDIEKWWDSQYVRSCPFIALS